MSCWKDLKNKIYVLHITPHLGGDIGKDVTSPHWPGVKQAVREFSAREKAAFVPLSDLCGSAVFVKS